MGRSGAGRGGRVVAVGLGWWGCGQRAVPLKDGWRLGGGLLVLFRLVILGGLVLLADGRYFFCLVLLKPRRHPGSGAHNRLGGVGVQVQVRAGRREAVMRWGGRGVRCGGRHGWGACALGLALCGVAWRVCRGQGACRARACWCVVWVGAVVRVR